jgi:TrmH family RNA methyltransferase
MPHYNLNDYLRDNGKSKGLFVLLEDLQDPGNLGTIFRTGEGAGVSGIIMTKNTADIFNPKVIRSTMGSIYRVPFFTVDSLEDTINLLKENNISVYAAHLDNSVNYDEANYLNPTAFLIGNEAKGLKRQTADLATAYIKIPMEGRVESLNAAVAASILMYEASRQRRINK